MAKAKNEVILDIFDEMGEGELPSDDGLWRQPYKVLQWHNPSESWYAPADSWNGTPLEFKFNLVKVKHQTGKSDGFLLPSVSIAPFAWRSYWEFRDGNDELHTSEKPDFSTGQKWTSRYHILAILKEAESFEPVLITAGGYTGEYLYNAITQAQARIKNSLRKINRPNVPGYLFWIEMVAGPEVVKGKGDLVSTISPPVAPPPANIKEMKTPELARWLTDSYVGHEIKDLFADGLFEQGQQWALEKTETLALAAQSEAASSVSAQLLDDGSLWFPDLSEASKADWRNCALSIPGLFDSEEEASNAMAKVLRSARCRTRKPADQWECWREELVKLWDDLQATLQEQARELEERQ